MALSKSEAAQLKAGVATFANELNRLSMSHYSRSGDELLASLDTDLGRKQYARLLGVLVKEPFADTFDRRPTKATGARIGLAWKSPGQIDRTASKTWQGPFVDLAAHENLLALPGGATPARSRTAARKAKQKKPRKTKPIQALAATAKSETSLGKAILRAFHNRICGTAEASQAVKDAINKAKAEGVKLTDPTTAGISVGAASLVAVTIGTLFSGPIAVAAAPVIGGIALLLMQTGVEGFCDWSGGKP